MDGFIGEVRIFPWNWAPEGWLWCNGTQVSVSQQQALYAVIGNNYGGNSTGFNLPNFQGQAAIGVGAGPGLTPRNFGTAVNGTESVTLTSPQMPSHNHDLTIQSNGPTGGAAGPTAGTSTLTRLFSGSGTNTCKDFSSVITEAPNSTLAPATLGPTGSNGPHENRQPYLPMMFCMCVSGEFPIRP